MGRFCFVTMGSLGLIMGRMIMGNDVQAFTSEYTNMQHKFIIPQLIPFLQSSVERNAMTHEGPAFITTTCVQHP
jgi:hypothetical protein